VIALLGIEGGTAKEEQFLELASGLKTNT